MISLQKIRNTTNKCEPFVYGFIAILIITGSIFVYSSPISKPTLIQDPMKEYGLMNQSSLEENPKLNQIPSHWLKYLSEEDLRMLEKYGEYQTEFSEEDLAILETYDQEFTRLSDSNQSSLNAYDYFTDQWNPQEFTYEMPAEELPNFEESLDSIFFDEWVTKPSYSLLDEAGKEVIPEITIGK